jgi:ABC-type transport system involved in cytochrome bd biosynthesis fused ATPase/permease subunit
MFSLDTMSKFRNFSEEQMFHVDDNVKEAWTSFLNDFCRLVSYEWNYYLKNILHKESATFFGSLTTSDEAFAEWVIFCKYDEVREETEEIIKIGREEWVVNKRKRKKVHMTAEKNYIIIQQFIGILLITGKTKWLIQNGKNYSSIAILLMIKYLKMTLMV